MLVARAILLLSLSATTQAITPIAEGNGKIARCMGFAKVAGIKLDNEALMHAMDHSEGKTATSNAMMFGAGSASGSMQTFKALKPEMQERDIARQLFDAIQCRNTVPVKAD